MSLKDNPIMEARDQIRQTVTMEDALTLLGLPEPNRQGKIHSIYSNERTPSLHVYQDSFYDFSTGQGGDVIRFVEDAAGVSFREAVEILSNGRSLAPLGRMPERKEKEVLDLTKQMQAAWCNETLDALDWDVVDDWARERWGLTSADLVAFGCGLMGEQSNDLWIPHVNPDTGTIPGIKVRRVGDSQKWSYPGSNFTQSLYFPRPHWSARKEPSVVLVEGESDAWVLRKLLDGRPVSVAGLPTGAGTWRREYVRQLTRRFDWIATIFDGDNPGQKAARTVAETVNVTCNIIPPGGRLAEAVLDGWNPFP